MGLPARSTGRRRTPSRRGDIPPLDSFGGPTTGGLVVVDAEVGEGWRQIALIVRGMLGRPPRWVLRHLGQPLAGAPPPTLAMTPPRIQSEGEGAPRLPPRPRRKRARRRGADPPTF